MNNEESRLRTFNEWPSDAAVDPIRIAKAGFFYTGQGLEVQCFSCGGKISEWNYGDQVMAKHRRLDQHCPFVINPATSGNVPKLMNSSSSLSLNVSTPLVLETTTTTTTTPVYSASLVDSSTSLPTSSATISTTACDTTSDNLYRMESNRLKSFLNWPAAEIVPGHELAKAGFYSLKDGDKVQCAYCNGIAQFWESGDNPKTEHKKHFPQCQFVKNNFNPIEVLKTPIDGNTKLVSADNMQELGIQAHKGPTMSRYATLESRLRTFVSWSVDLIQTPEMLADAGFYYVGTGDQVRCFHCDGGLRHWDPEDEPWVEHARWFPACAFVRLIKGQDFIQSCNPQELPHNNLISTIRPPTNSRTTHVNREISDQEIQTHMNSAPALAALSIGLHMGRVKQAIRQKILQTGTGYTSADALIEAALNLQLEESDIPTELDTTISEQVRNILSTAVSNNSKPNSADTGRLKVVENERTVATTVKLSLEEENRQLKEARLCKICMDNEIGVVFLPCGHLTTCVNCAPSLKDCPVCRSVIKGTVRTFLS